MIDQTDFPPKWSADCSEKRAKVEIRVPNDDPNSPILPATDSVSYTWIEIPTTSVELWEEKGGASNIQRSAKVKFPVQWGRIRKDIKHNSPYRLLRRFNPQESESSPFIFSRISFKDSSNEWIIKHFGWVGGIGRSAQEGVAKFWVFDVAEMLGGVPVGATFNKPTIGQASEIIANITNDNTPIPVGDVLISTPQSEEELAVFYDQLGDRDISAPRDTDLRDRQDVVQSGILGFLMGGETVEESEEILEGSFDEIEIDTSRGFIRDALRGFVSTKSFASNHDTLLDVYEWFGKKTGAKIYFDPHPQGNSVIMVVDIVPTRLKFADNEVISSLDSGLVDSSLYDDYTIHGRVSVIKNNALYEIKPYNTVRLRGDVGESYKRSPSPFLPGTAYELRGGGPPSETFPIIKVQVPALVEAADGVELAPETIESDATTLEEAEKEAIDELSKIMEEVTEGEIIIRGNPYVSPYHSIDAFEVCNSVIAEENEPARYEVESVKHTAKGGEEYKTRLMVSVWANERNIEVVESKMETI